ncbi:MAG: outer membrane beta-barrel protein [Candidatus Coatesbacteria bacterium]|nr:MAG: outer membrane beta-barrel protein [Candidatus Coatesbacteria bacterium]
MRYIWVILIAAAPAAALVWGVSVGGGLGIPAIDYTDIVSPSPVVEGRGLFCITPNVTVTAGVAYRVEHEPKEFERWEEASYRIIPALFGAVYRFEYLPLMPYAGGGVAAVIGTATVPTAEGTEDRKSTRLGGFVEGGTEYYFRENVGVDVRLRFLATFGGEAAEYGEQPVDADNYAAFDGVIGLFFYP